MKHLVQGLGKGSYNPKNRLWELFFMPMRSDIKQTDEY